MRLKGRSPEMKDWGYNKSLLLPISNSHVQPNLHSRDGRLEEWKETKRS